MAESSGSVNPPPPAQNSPPTGWSQDKLFVGRAREMAELRAALEDAYAGRGHLCLLAGEPGIGKTRTAEEFAPYARQRATLVLLGRYYEGEGAPPFWPWVQIVRLYLSTRDSHTARSHSSPSLNICTR